MALFNAVVLKRDFIQGERFLELYYNYPALETDKLKILVESENKYVGIPFEDDFVIPDDFVENIRFVNRDGIFDNSSMVSNSSELDSFVLDESVLG